MVLKIKNSSRAARKTFQLAAQITISNTNHTKLLKHITDRLTFSNTLRSNFVDAITLVDKEMAGYIVHDADDRKRLRDRYRGKGPKPVDVNLQFAGAQIDEAVTYLLSVIAPDSGMYEALGNAKEQIIANGITRTMNEHALDFNHYGNLDKCFTDMMKFNFGGLLIKWKTVTGNLIKNNEAEQAVIEPGIVRQGNAIEAVDPYNFLWDITVSPVDLATNGEYFATIEPRNKFQLERKQNEGSIYDFDQIAELGEAEFKYWKPKPQIRRNQASGDSTTGGETSTDWVNVLTAGVAGSSIGRGYEEIAFYAWIKPKDFGLGKEDTLSIWRFTVINSIRVVSAEQIITSHGWLPIALGMPIVDGLMFETKSFAEKLLPLQTFMNFKINIHQRADRKRLVGVTIYDGKVIPFGETPEEDLAGGMIPAKPTGADRDLRKSVLQLNDAPDTSNTMNDIQGAKALMQDLLPTDTLGQVASLERATTYQAAATVQASNKRNHKLAKIIHAQVIWLSLYMQYSNILMLQDEIEVMDDQGELQTISPATLRETKLQFAISDGLKGIDKLAMTEMIKDIINMLLQSQIAQDQIDIVKLIDYFTDLLGDNTDFNQFKFDNEFDKLSNEQKNIAFQLLQAAIAQGEQGATGAAVETATTPTGA